MLRKGRSKLFFCLQKAGRFKPRSSCTTGVGCRRWKLPEQSMGQIVSDIVVVYIVSGSLILFFKGGGGGGGKTFCCSSSPVAYGRGRETLLQEIAKNIQCLVW